MSEEKRYPCDTEKTYPCDTKKAYPCDEAAVYADNRTSGVRQDEATNTTLPKGKGRRGGNAGLSKVIHSGKIKTASGRGGYGENRSRSDKDGRSGETDRDTCRNTSRGTDRDTYRDTSRGTDRDSYRGTDRDSFRGDWKGGRGRLGESRSGARGYDRGDAQPGRSRMTESRGNDRGNRNGKYSTGVTRTAGKAGGRAGVFEEGSRHVLEVVKNTGIGSFLDLEGEEILLPFSEQTERPEEGDRVTVYLYYDKGNRVTASMRKPHLLPGETGLLRVADITKIGAFLDNGTPKQILLPFREQISQPAQGSEVLVYLYRDKSGRVAATMRVYKHLDARSPYKKDDMVTGFVYEINPELGVFLAVDNRYFGLLPAPETFNDYSYGDTVTARVVRVREDGKLDLSDREKSYDSLDADAEAILSELEKNGGRLDYADRADAGFIAEKYAMSKNQFKRALGHLYRQKKVLIDRDNNTVTAIEDKN